MSRSHGAKSPTQSDVRDELWHSFASMLKSYAAAASARGTSHGVLPMGEDGLHIAAGRNTLKVSYHPTLGRGLWSLHEGSDRHQLALQPRELDRGDFDVNPDGTIQLGGEAVEIDFAAIQLVAALTAAAGRSQIRPETLHEIEVPA
jgi:hypothetical protein